MEYVTYWRSPPNGGGLVTLEFYEEDKRKICGIFRIEGRLNLPPKQWLRAMRAELKTIEDEARKVGFAELRMAGRDWSRIVEGYEPLPGVPNGLRKVL